MRWNRPKKKHPVTGDRRITTRFAWFPTEVDGRGWVWLERITEVEVYLVEGWYHIGFTVYERKNKETRA